MKRVDGRAVVAFLAVAVPEKLRTGRPNEDRRRILNGMLWVRQTGAPWGDPPQCYGPVATVSSLPPLTPPSPATTVFGPTTAPLPKPPAWTADPVDTPSKSNQRRQPCFDRGGYRRRSRIRCLINRLKQFRRVATCYEKRGINYLYRLYRTP